MTGYTASLLLVPFLVAMFLAVNMGGSGTSPAFAVAYGSRAIRKGLVPVLFGSFVFLGAIIAGKKVTLTIGSGILPNESMGLILTVIILLSVSLSLLVANLLRVPQSTSQATVFALMGSAVYLGNLRVHRLVFEILPFWFVLPIVSFIITLFGYRILRRRAGRQSLQFLGRTARPWKYVVILASCYVAFAIGSNNVANAAGPIASMMGNELGIGPNSESYLLVITLAVLIVAPCFGIGSFFLGGRVAQMTGKSIVDIGAFDAVFISTITGTLLLFASLVRGIPMSLVQLNTGAIIALGISRAGWKEGLTCPAVKRVFIVWIVAPLISLTLSFLFTTAAGRMGFV